LCYEDLTEINREIGDRINTFIFSLQPHNDDEPTINTNDENRFDVDEEESGNSTSASTILLASSSSQPQPATNSKRSFESYLAYKLRANIEIFLYDPPFPIVDEYKWSQGIYRYLGVWFSFTSIPLYLSMHLFFL
jgi:hypothetical protein